MYAPDFSYLLFELSLEEAPISCAYWKGVVIYLIIFSVIRIVLQEDSKNGTEKLWLEV